MRDQNWAFPLPPTYSYQTGKRVVEKDYQFSFKDDVWPDDMDNGQGGENARKDAAIQIVTPNTGTPFYFHRLLVMGTPMKLSAKYELRVDEKERVPKSPSWFGLFG